MLKINNSLYLNLPFLYFFSKKMTHFHHFQLKIPVCLCLPSLIVSCHDSSKSLVFTLNDFSGTSMSRLNKLMTKNNALKKLLEISCFVYIKTWFSPRAFFWPSYWRPPVFSYMPSLLTVVKCTQFMTPQPRLARRGIFTTHM